MDHGELFCGPLIVPSEGYLDLGSLVPSGRVTEASFGIQDETAISDFRSLETTGVDRSIAAQILAQRRVEEELLKANQRIKTSIDLNLVGEIKSNCIEFMEPGLQSMLGAIHDDWDANN